MKADVLQLLRDVCIVMESQPNLDRYQKARLRTLQNEAKERGVYVLALVKERIKEMIAFQETRSDGQ